MKIGRVVALVLGLALCVAVAACGSSSSDGGSAEGTSATAKKDDSPITIGFVVGETGLMSQYDGPIDNFAYMAIKDINAKGGIAGRPIRYFSVDTKSDPGTAATAAQEALSRGADVLVVSADYDHGAPAALIAQKNNVLAFSGARSPEFGPAGIGDLAFSPGAASVNDSAIAAEWAYKSKGWRTAYLLSDPTLEITQTTAAGWEWAWKRLAPNGLVGKDVFNQKDTSIAPQIARIKALNPQPNYIYLNSYGPGGVSAIRQIRAAGIKIPLVITQAFDGDYWLRSVPHLNDTYLVTVDFMYGKKPNYSPDPGRNKIYSAYVDKYGSLPASSEGITGYSMIYEIARAIEQAEGSTDGPTLAANLEKFKDVKVPGTDSVTFTPDVHMLVKRKDAVIGITDSKMHFVEYWEPSQVAPLG